MLQEEDMHPKFANLRRSDQNEISPDVLRTGNVVYRYAPWNFLDDDETSYLNYIAALFFFHGRLRRFYIQHPG